MGITLAREFQENCLKNLFLWPPFWSGLSDRLKYFLQTNSQHNIAPCQILFQYKQLLKKLLILIIYKKIIIINTRSISDIILYMLIGSFLLLLVWGTTSWIIESYLQTLYSLVFLIVCIYHHNLTLIGNLELGFTYKL